MGEYGSEHRRARTSLKIIWYARLIPFVFEEESLSLSQVLSEKFERLISFTRFVMLNAKVVAAPRFKSGEALKIETRIQKEFSRSRQSQTL
jgi:hypothetical protein